MGQVLSGDDQALAQRLDRVRSVLGPRPGDPQGPVFDEPDRESQCPFPSGGPGQGHFPNEQAALKTLYLTVRSLDPKGTGQTRWGMRWKPALNAFAITFADRMPAVSTHQ